MKDFPRKDNKMTTKERINILKTLGDRLIVPDEYLNAVMKRTEFNNGWLTVANQRKAIDAIVTQFLDGDKLEQWATQYTFASNVAPRKIGLVMAGNIPLVGFHDFLCVFIAGDQALVKLSSKDPYLFPYLVQLMEKIDSRVADYVKVVDRLQNYDAVIATGSNNSAKYFEAYFGKVPHIIRKNRNGVAVLTGKETEQELKSLGKDIFEYFGLGCRNVSKIYVPEGYNFEPLLEALHTYNKIVLNTKYKNNFDYNYAVYMLNKVPFKANGCIILVEQEAIPSNIATLHYEYYSDMSSLAAKLEMLRDEIQEIVASADVKIGLPTIPFGDAQQPTLFDYPDGVDTMKFITSGT